MSITESQARAFLATLHGLPDDRHPVADGDRPPRRVAFERGWKDRARKTYSERSLGRLTWQNLGYRARDAFEGHDPADVFEAFRRLHDADRPAPNAPAPTLAPTGHRPRVYISYARNDGATPTRELAAALTRRGVDVEFDETGIAPGERIRAFMDRLIDGDQIFVVISDASLRSPHCMYELYGIWQRSRRDGDTFLRHVIPLVMPGTRIDRPEDRVAHARHWRQRFRDLETLVRDDPELVGPGDFAEFKRMADYARHVGEMLYLIADRLVPRDLAALARADFAPLVDLLRE